MADPLEMKRSKAVIEAIIAGKSHLLALLPPGFQEKALDNYANEACPDGSEKERGEFKRYWRDRLDRVRDRIDLEQERGRRATPPSDGYFILPPGKVSIISGGRPPSPEAAMPDPVDTSPQVLKTGRRRGRLPDRERRAAIHKAIIQYGSQWRDHLSEVYTELEDLEAALGGFQAMTIDLGDGESTKVSKWTDLDLADGKQRRKIVDCLRKYVDGWK
jgi:hypothetical protein